MCFCGTENKKNRTTLAVREGALCAGRLASDVPARSVRCPCDGHGEAESRPVPTHSSARRWGCFACGTSNRRRRRHAGRQCRRRYRPRVGVGGGGGGPGRVTTSTAADDRSSS